MAREFHYLLSYNIPNEEKRYKRERINSCREVAFGVFCNFGDMFNVEVEIYNKPSQQTKEICERLKVTWIEVQDERIEWGAVVKRPAYILSGNDDTIFLAFYWCILADRIESYDGAVEGSFADRLKEWMGPDELDGSNRLWAELVENNSYPAWNAMKSTELCPVWWAEEYWWGYSGYEKDD